MKFSRKMLLMTILKVTKKQGFTLFTENAFMEKPDGVKLTPLSNPPPPSPPALAFLGLNEKRFFYAVSAISLKIYFCKIINKIFLEKFLTGFHKTNLHLFLKTVPHDYFCFLNFKTYLLYEKHVISLFKLFFYFLLKFCLNFWYFVKLLYAEYTLLYKQPFSRLGSVLISTGIFPKFEPFFPN